MIHQINGPFIKRAMRPDLIFFIKSGRMGVFYDSSDQIIPLMHQEEQKLLLLLLEMVILNVYEIKLLKNNDSDHFSHDPNFQIGMKLFSHVQVGQSNMITHRNGASKVRKELLTLRKKFLEKLEIGGSVVL